MAVFSRLEEKLCPAPKIFDADFMEMLGSMSSCEIIDSLN